jgi:hypothetical protein
MHDDQPQALSGPDFLEQLADNAAGEGLMINAAEYRRRAHQWRQDINTIAAAADDITRLQRQLNSARQSLAA